MQVHTSAPEYLEWNAQRKTVFPNKYVHLESLRQAALCGYGYGLCPVMVWWVSHSRCYDLMGVTSMLLMAHVYCHMNLAKSASSEWIYLIPETFGKFCKWHHWRFVKPVRWGGGQNSSSSLPVSIQSWVVTYSPYPNFFIHTLYWLGFTR